MLYWICPECGHECSPAIRECPTCTAAENAAPTAEQSPQQTSADVLLLAQSLQSKPVSPARPTEPAKPWVTQEVSPVPPPIAAPALIAAKSPQAEFGLKRADLAPIGDIGFQAALLRLPKAHEQPVEPAPSRRRSVAFVREALPGVNTSGLAWADLAHPDQVRPAPLQAGNETANETANEISAAPLHPKAGSLAFISSKIELAGESLTEMLHALESSAAELERAAIRAIQASFQDHPAELLLCGASEIVTAPAPPAEQWMRSPRLVFTAKASGNSAPAILTAAPRPPTLAGPCLPPQLQRFTQSQNSNRRPAKKRPAAPAWMITVLIIALFLGGSSLVQYLTANREAKAASASAAPTETRQPAPAPAFPAAEEHPGARFVEVAGVRVVTAPNRKPQLQYIVINHSAAELTGLNIHIAGRSADSPSSAPLFNVSSIVPSLGANQSKEIRTDLDAGINPASIPDWQSLRTDVLIARQ
jgi:hypothetical protein